MSTFHIYTIIKPSEGLFKEKGSKFLAFAFPVATEEEIKDKLELLRKEYYDARHHCYAWMLGADKSRYRANDDGEPNHTAGDPILGQIRSRDLTNIMVVVIRYFGGTKLGVSGLIQAYRNAAEEALKNATILRKELTEEFTLTYPYESTTEVQRLIKDFELSIVHQQFDLTCNMILRVRLAVKDPLIEKIVLLQSTGTTLTYLQQKK